MGGTAATRLTTAGSGVDGKTLAATGGAQSHALTVGELPSHAHDVVDNGHTHTADNAVTYVPPQFQSTASDPVNNPILPDVVSSFLGGQSNGFLFVGGAYRGSFVVTPGSVGVTTTIERSTSNITVSPAGNSNAHPTVPPAMIMNYIIKN
jgi:microcystin-dependent protein